MFGNGTIVFLLITVSYQCLSFEVFGNGIIVFLTACVKSVSFVTKVNTNAIHPVS